MRRIIVLAVIFFGAVFFNSDSSAKEIKIGKMRTAKIGSQIISVYFEGIDNRSCIVNIKILEEGKEPSFKKVTFDWEREEVEVPFGNKKFFMYYVMRGLTVYIDGKEI